MVKRGIFCLFFLAIAFSFPSILKRFTYGFKIAKMRLEIPFRSDWETSPFLSQEELSAILSQPFSFLDKGAQCYVFQSEDGRYVVKLFRYDQRRFFSSQKKCEKLFSACLLAYNLAREETGLVHLHLNRTMGELPVLHAKGPIGQTLRFPLDKYRFAIQKKAKAFRETLLKADDREAFSQLIDSFISLLQARIEKGIGNSDSTLHRNFGFFEGKALEIDFGNYFADPPSKIHELYRYTRRLRRWLKRHAPEWVSYLDEKVKECELRLSS